jgi:hypothetical protein
MLSFEGSLDNTLSQMKKDNGNENIAFVIFNYPQQVHKYSKSTQTIWNSLKD